MTQLLAFAPAYCSGAFGLNQGGGPAGSTGGGASLNSVLVAKSISTASAASRAKPATTASSSSFCNRRRNQLWSGVSAMTRNLRRARPDGRGGPPWARYHRGNEASASVTAGSAVASSISIRPARTREIILGAAPSSALA